MPTDPTLRDIFRSSPEPSARRIDTDAVIRRSKARRLPAQLGIGGAFTLAAGGIVFGGVNALNPTGTTTAASDAAAESAGDGAADNGTFGTGTDSGTDTGTDTGRVDPETGDVNLDDTPGSDEAIKRAPAEKLNLCGGTLAEVAPSETGLVLTAAFPDGQVGAASVTGSVTLTNTGTTAVSGYMSPVPAITLSQDGVVLWHSNGPTILSLQMVDLAPGESLELAASFSPVVCTVDDDLGEAFRTDLPAAPAGDYQVSAAADVVVGEVSELVTGPVSTVRLG
jgi:hypothetical protein